MIWKYARNIFSKGFILHLFPLMNFFILNLQNLQLFLKQNRMHISNKNNNLF